MISNVNVYLAIAEEALAESQNLDRVARSPRPDGQPGSVIAWDPQQKSFKQSMVALVFAGVYLEALLYLVGVARFGKTKSLAIDKKKYEERLSDFGLSDADLLASCERFRKARKDLVHEKAIEAGELENIDPGKFRWAQKEAEHGVSFVKRVAVLLQQAPEPADSIETGEHNA